MAPIRIGFIGLSSDDAAWSAVAHLPYLRQSDRYVLVAVLNSSVTSAQKSIEFNKLDPTTKAYGDPEAFARDPKIDLVVCSVRVDRHYQLIKPSLEAGKDCFVEWPLASNLRDAEELAALAKRKGVRAVVGLQGRLSSVINKVKQMVEEGRIGDVLSTTFVGAANEGGRTARETYDYFYNSKVGGNMLTIHVAHNLDNITWALGEIESLTARLSIAQPEGRVINLETGRTVRIVIRDTPDQVMFHGTLTNSTSASKVPISYHVRGPPFKGEPPFRWNIYGTKGEFLIVNPELMAISVIDTGATIRLHDFESGNVQDIQWTSDDATAESSLPQSAKNVSRLYEAFANGEMHKLVTFEEAVVRHRMVDMIETNSQF